MHGVILLEMKKIMTKKSFISNYWNNLKRELSDLYRMIKHSKFHINLHKLRKTVIFIVSALLLIYIIYLINVSEVVLAFFLSTIVAVLIEGVVFLFSLLVFGIFGKLNMVTERFSNLYSTFHIILGIIILLFIFFNFEYVKAL